MQSRRSVVFLAADNEIVEMMVLGRLYWATRKSFRELAEVSGMLEAAISAGADLPTIQHIFDESESMGEIKTRFDRWRAGKSALPHKKSGGQKQAKPVSRPVPSNGLPDT